MSFIPNLNLDPNLDPDLVLDHSSGPDLDFNLDQDHDLFLTSGALTM